MSSQPGSKSWRHAQRDRLLAFARQSVRDEGGFVWLTETGTPDPDKGLELWINARMTYVFGLAALAGDADALTLAAHGVRALSTVFHDDEHGGWYDEVALEGGTSD